MSIWDPRRQSTSAKSELLSLFPRPSGEAEDNSNTGVPLPGQPEVPADPQPEQPAFAEIFKNDDTLARLLRAVESTNFDFKMQVAEPAAEQISECAHIEPLSDSSNPTKLANESAERLSVSRTLEGTESAITPFDPTSEEVLEPSDADPCRKTTINLVSSSSVPWASDSAPAVIALLSVTQRLVLDQEKLFGSRPSLSLGPPPPAEGETIDWGFGDALFKPPAPLEEEALLKRIENRVIGHAPNVVVKLVDRLGESFAWLVDEQSKEEPAPQDFRRADRLINPPLIAHYWTGGPSRAHKIADLSSTGLYLLTKDRWRPGTRILMRLQRTDLERNSKDRGLAVEFMILRWGRDGLGGVFIPSVPGINFNPAGVDLVGASKETLDGFVRRLREYQRSIPGRPLPGMPDISARK